MKPNPKDKIVLNAQQVIATLKEKYPKGEYALLTEVGNSTGFQCARHADAIVMSLWPSRGLQIIGFEVKVSRTDWLKELANSEKADVIYGYCDLWFLAIGDESIVHDGELPPNWGLMVPKKDGLATKVLPTQNSNMQLDRGFIAAMLRRAQEQLTPEADLKNEFKRGRAEGVEAGKKYMGYILDDYKRLQKTVKTFEKASGVSVEKTWDTEAIGEAVRLVRNGQYVQMVGQLGRLADAARKIATDIDNQIAKTKDMSNAKA